MLELSRPLPTDRIGAAKLRVVVEASEAECAAIARRLMLPSVGALRCEWQLHSSHGNGIEAEGSLSASLHQVCVVSLDEFPTQVVESFAVRFVPDGHEDELADDPDEPDEIPFEGGALDLGEATVQQLALSLDTYPRKPGAELAAPDAEAQPTPWDALAKWRQPH